MCQIAPPNALSQAVVSSASCRTVNTTHVRQFTTSSLLVSRVFRHLQSRKKCESCCKHRSFQKHQWWMQLFPPKGATEFLAIDILRPLTKTNQRNRYVVVMKDRFSKLTTAIPTVKVTTSWTRLSFSNTESFCIKSQILWRRTTV